MKCKFPRLLAKGPELGREMRDDNFGLFRSLRPQLRQLEVETLLALRIADTKMLSSRSL